MDTMFWPDDADGDVFRRLHADRFDFSSAHEIDFNVDFSSWPPHPSAIGWLKQEYGAVRVYEPEEECGGYVQFQIVAHLTYELVTATQARVSTELGRFGGICESWGVLQSPTE